MRLKRGVGEDFRESRTKEDQFRELSGRNDAEAETPVFADWRLQADYWKRLPRCREGQRE